MACCHLLGYADNLRNHFFRFLCPNPSGRDALKLSAKSLGLVDKGPCFRRQLCLLLREGLAGKKGVNDKCKTPRTLSRDVRPVDDGFKSESSILASALYASIAKGF